MTLTWDERTKRALTSIGDRDEISAASIAIGGSDPSKFVPNLNVSKWDDEAFINFNLPAVAVANQQATFTNGLTELTVGPVTLRFYVDLNNRIEWEIEFSRRTAVPAVIEIPLLLSPNVEIFYQDFKANIYTLDVFDKKMTYEEFDQFYGRAEDVEGSYAFYIDKRNNKYKTGKLAHWYRNKLIDADGKTVWVDSFTIERISPTTAIARLTLPSAFVQSAKYPIILDPNTGYESCGSNFLNAAQQWSKWTVAADGGGVIQSISACVYNAADSSNEVKLAVWDDDGSDALVDYTAAVYDAVWDTSPEFATKTAAVGYNIPNSRNIIIGQGVRENTSRLAHDRATGPGLYIGSATWSTIPDPASYTDLYSGWRGSAYITTAAGGSTYSETAADGFKIGESMAGEGMFPRTATDGLTFSDLASAIASMLATGADGFTIGDTSIGGNVFDVSIADGAVFGDTAAASISFSLTATDGLTLGDSASNIGTLPTVAVDGLTLSDVAAIIMTIQSVATDGVVFGDLAGLGTTYQVDATDGLTLGDSSQTILQAVAQAMDGLVHGDTSEIICTFQVTAQDGLTLGEAALAITTMLASAIDGVKIGDSAAGVTSVPSGEVNVTFSGRQATITFTARKPGVTITSRSPGITFTVH